MAVGQTKRTFTKMREHRGLAVLVVLTLLWIKGVSAAERDTRLADAVQGRDTAAVQTLLQQRVDVNSPQADGATALAWAAHWDDLATADLLIRAGARVNAANDQGVTALALACANGSAAMVGHLIDAGANPNLARTTGETPLMTAAFTGNTDVVKALIAAGADVNAAGTGPGQSALMWAVSEKHAEIVRILVSAKADVRARSAGGFSALLFAARQGDIESAKMLLDAGADVDDRARDGSTALVIAAASGREDMVLLLLQSGASAGDGAAGYTALHASVPKDMRLAVKALLRHGADPNARLKNAPATLFGPGRGAGSEVMPAAGTPASGGAGSFTGATPFWLAAKNVNVAVMELLIAGGADASLTNENGTTPLMAAAGLTQIQGPRARRGDVSQFYSNWGESDSLDALKFLLDHGADVNAANRSGQTALHGAAYMGGKAVVEFLLDHGVNINVPDAQGQTPFRIAEAHLNVAAQGVTEWPETAALLRRRGADISLGVDGRTMLRRYINLKDTSADGKPAESRPR
jgi:ankyrin repeat protein